jgi:hypothetical protein
MSFQRPSTCLEMGLDNFPGELIEIILVSLNDERTLLLAQRVCRRWAHCIQGSRILYNPTPLRQPFHD